MGEPLPNCPLCGAKMTEARQTRQGWLYCATYVRDLTCNMPVVREDQLRALAALRKPLTEDAAMKLMMAVVDAEWCGIDQPCDHPRGDGVGATCGIEPRAALMAELTGGTYGR